MPIDLTKLKLFNEKIFPRKIFTESINIFKPLSLKKEGNVMKPSTTSFFFQNFK